MGRRRKKKEVPLKTALLLSGGAVVVVVIILVVIMARSGGGGWGPAGWPRRHHQPMAVKSADDAWKRLEGKWSVTEKFGRDVSKVEYEFTADRRLIFRSSLSGGRLQGPMNHTSTQKIVGIEVENNEILLTLTDENGQDDGIMTVWFESEKVLSVEGEEFKREG
jgi:hypothetical protein